MESKRLAIAFALSAAVLVVWTILFPQPKPSPRPAVPAATAAPAATTVPTAAPVASAPSPRAPVEPIAAEKAEVVVVAMPLYTARITNAGGALEAFVLARFQDAKGEALDLVRRGAGFSGKSLALEPKDAFETKAQTALYRVEREDAKGVTRIVLTYREADGNGIRRTYVFRPDSYVVSLKVEREGGTGLPVAVKLGPGIGNPSTEELASRYTKPGSTIALTAAGSVERHPKDALKEDVALGKGVTAAGVEDNYFLAAFLPSPAVSVTLRPIALSTTSADGKAATDGESVVEASGVGTLDTDLYFGPKELATLEKVRPGMQRVIDFGWFPVIVRPLLWGLTAIHKAVGNWGVAIILITVVIKIALYPLTHKQLVSMKKMSKLQPRLETIRAKWATKIKSDPQARLKMNEEMMALYKTEGVNPAGGCLPLLLQLPILWAFYNLLAHAIELRHAPFIFWIHDLSAKDPYYVTPILMTLTQWFSQQTMPATGDAAMRRVQSMMPFLFGFLFKDLPAGLVLYWLVQNILTIVQQVILNRYTDLGPAAMARAKAS